MDLKKITGGLILVIGVFAFTLNISNNNINIALIYLTVSLIFWVLWGLILNVFDIRIFSWIISASGFIVAISVLLIYGIEEVSYPIGAIIFHSGGFASALGIGLFSLFPILFLHNIDNVKVKRKSKVIHKITNKDPDPKIISKEWDIASDDDLQSGEFEVG